MAPLLEAVLLYYFIVFTDKIKVNRGKRHIVSYTRMLSLLHIPMKSARIQIRSNVLECAIVVRL